MRTVLTGIAWNHSRAFPPLVATAQRFEERHPDVEIRWSKRSLHDFGHANPSELAQEFDLIVMDHPWSARAFETQAVLTLENRAPKGLFEEWSVSSIGGSFESYLWEGHLLCVPIDGAAPFASYRADLLAAAGVGVPSTWQDVLSLAKRKLVVMPGHAVDLLISFLGLCASQGERLFEKDGCVVDKHIGKTCLDQLRELTENMPGAIFQWNPIQVYEQMSQSDQFAYCPFAYGYNNYSRAGFARRQVLFTDLVTLANGRPVRGVLGGTGIGISTRCAHIDLAIEYVAYVASSKCQTGLYFLAGGQPSHRAVWTDPATNALTGDFFKSTLRSMEEAWIRPRYSGFVRFQERAGAPLVRYLKEGGNQESTLCELDRLYQESLPMRCTDTYDPLDR